MLPKKRQPPGRVAASKRWPKENPLEWKKVQHRAVLKLKKETFVEYSTKIPQCRICGFKDLDCLDLDHIDNDGAADRKAKLVGPTKYRKLKREGYPPGYQILCKNCNWKKFLNHLRKKYEPA